MLSRLRAAVLVAAAMAIAYSGVARADGPGVGPAAVAALGDSAISGEAGRWAGNTNSSSSRVDALGATAYHDVAGREAISGCHRSKAAEVHIGGGVPTVNLACSGARTSTSVGDTFKPGIDFYSDSSGRKGQALALQEWAATHNVKAVALLIGANNYGFADIVQACVTNWLTSPSWWKNYCSDDSGLTSRFTAARKATELTNVRNALLRVRQAMANAGYADGMYTILAQTYTSPIPRSSGFRYGETGWNRQSIGGCGVWNRDADWAQDTVVRTFNDTITQAVSTSGLTNVKVLDAETAFNGPAAVREHRRAARGARRGELDVTGRRRRHRVGQPDPHRDDDLRPVPASGGRAPELLGPACAAQLPAPGLQRRRSPWRPLHALGQRPEQPR